MHSNEWVKWASACVSLGFAALGVGAITGGCFEAKFEDAPLVALPGVESAAEEGAIPGQYIVVLKDDFAGAEFERTRDFVEQQGGVILHSYEGLMPAFAAKIPDIALKQLGNSSAVKAIRHDHWIRPTSLRSCTPSWGLDRIDQKNLPLNNAYANSDENPGEGVDVYVFDTGIDAASPEFDGRVVGSFDMTNGNGVIMNDCHGHGTHVAGVIGGSTYGVAAKVNLVSMQVFDCPGKGNGQCGPVGAAKWGTESNIMNGIKEMHERIKQGQNPMPSVAVLNFEQGNSASFVANAMIAASNDLGAKRPLYVVSAGNSEFDSCKRWYADPATKSQIADYTLVIGASAPNDGRAAFSNFGGCVDLFAPGQGIKSALPTTPNCFPGESILMSGTSQAAAHAAGVAARRWARNPALTASEIKNELLGDASAGAIDVSDGSPNAIVFVDSNREGLQIPAEPCEGVVADCVAGGDVVCCNKKTKCNQSIICYNGECEICGTEGKECCVTSNTPGDMSDGCGENLACGEVSGLCECGGLGQDCCGGPGGTCDSPLACGKQFKVCGDCGIKGAPCCHGVDCGSGLTCDAGTCVECGGAGEACCDNAVCESGKECVAGMCKSCGGNGQPCCGSTDCGNGLSCSSGTCVSCGGDGEPCCGASCGNGMACEGGTCKICGAAGQKCCPGLNCMGNMQCGANGLCKGYCETICRNGITTHYNGDIATHLDCNDWAHATCKMHNPKLAYEYRVKYNGTPIGGDGECGSLHQACCFEKGSYCNGAACKPSKKYSNLNNGIVTDFRRCEQ